MKYASVWRTDGETYTWNNEDIIWVVQVPNGIQKFLTTSEITDQTYLVCEENARLRNRPDLARPRLWRRLQIENGSGSRDLKVTCFGSTDLKEIGSDDFIKKAPAPP